MSKIMPLDILSSITGAKPSEAVEELFLKVKSAVNEIKDNIEIDDNSLDLEMLRQDVVIKPDEEEIKIIRQNFPLQKDGYLIVPRVIEE